MGRGEGPSLVPHQAGSEVVVEGRRLVITDPLPGADAPWGGALVPPLSAPWAGVMGAAWASTAGHLPPAFNDLSETQTACTTGHGTSGFLLLMASLGTSPLPFFSLFLTSFTSHHTTFTTPSGVIFHSMLRTAATSLSTTWPCGQRNTCQSPPFSSLAKWMGQTLLFLKLET